MKTTMDDAFRWNDWNLDHIAIHGVIPAEAEYVVDHAKPPYPEQIGDQKWRVRGRTGAGRYLQVIFLFDPDGTIFVIHARGLTHQELRQFRRRTR